MSTKIYNAFRLKKSVDLWPFLWKLQATAQENVQTALKAHYWELVRSMDTETPEYKEERAKEPDTLEHRFRLARVRDTVRNGFRENVTKMDRDTYSLEVAVAIYPNKGRYYLRTFCEGTSAVGTVLDFVEHLPELEDFHFQNSTDRPDEVSARDWAHRREVWDEITKTDDVGLHVTLGILEWTSFYRLDPLRDLALEWKANPPTLPSREEYWAGEIQALRSCRNDKITFEPGLSIQSPKFLILRQEDGAWLVTLKKRKPRRFPTLNRAADFVWFEFQPEQTKETVRRMMREAKERRRAAKK